jgi:hypothetical protein
MLTLFLLSAENVIDAFDSSQCAEIASCPPQLLFLKYPLIRSEHASKLPLNVLRKNYSNRERFAAGHLTYQYETN